MSRIHVERHFVSRVGWRASRGFNNLDIYLGSMGAWKAAHG